MDFPMDFWLFWMCFISVLFKVIDYLSTTSRHRISDVHTGIIFHTFWGLSSFPIYLLDALDLLLEKVGLQEVTELTVPLIRGNSVQLQQAFIHLNSQIFYIIPVCSGSVCFWASCIRIRILPSTSKKKLRKTVISWLHMRKKKHIFCWYLEM